MAPRPPRRRRTRRLAARPRGRSRLAPAAHRENIRQTHRAPRLAPRRRLDAVLQAPEFWSTFVAHPFRGEAFALQVTVMELSAKILRPAGLSFSPFPVSIFKFPISRCLHGTRCTITNTPPYRSGARQH